MFYFFTYNIQNFIVYFIFNSSLQLFEQINIA